jgi:rhodanese-related sulfurtransferase
MQPRVPSVQVGELQPGALLLDVREHDEWTAGHIDGAVHVPMYHVPDRISDEPFDAAHPVYVICKVGSRSAHVTAWLNQQGYDAYNVDGGMLAWAATGRPMTSDTSASPKVV